MALPNDCMYQNSQCQLNESTRFKFNAMLVSKLNGHGIEKLEVEEIQFI